MDKDFITFLSTKGITETKYIDGDLAAQATLVEAFEMSKKSKTNIICSHSSFSHVDVLQVMGLPRK